MSRLLGKVVLREGSALVPRGIVHHPKNAALSLFYVLKCFTGLKVFLLLGLAAPGAGAAQGITLPSAASHYFHPIIYLMTKADPLCFSISYRLTQVGP